MTPPLVAVDALSSSLVRVGPEERPPACPASGHDVVYAVCTADPADAVLGLVTPCDIARHPQRIFADLAQRAPVVGVDTSLDDVSSALHGAHASAAAVMRGSELVGAVTLFSLQRALLRRQEALVQHAREDAEHLAAWSKRLEGLHSAARSLLALLGERLLEEEGLRRAVEVLAQLVEARYGAAGLLGSDGQLETFVTCGLGPEQVAAIRDRPAGRGLLGAVIREDQVIRVDDILRDPRSAGFPQGHPVMRSLLAVPVSQGGHVFGRIYLCDKAGGAPFTDDDERLACCLAGSVSAMLVSARALAQQRALEAQLLRAQKLEALGRLAGGVAHDFNNVLTVALCGTEPLLLRHDLPADVTDSLLDVTRCCQWGATLTRQLLTFGRQQPGRLGPLDLNATVEEAVRWVARLLGHEVVVHLSLAEGLPLVVAEPTLVTQVLLNLALNARDAMPGGGTIVVTTSRTSDRRGVELRVEDSGAGIPADALPHIFEPFFTTKGEGKGTGLGLATVEGIARQLGGTIAVTSDGHGTAFMLRLALASPSASEPAPAPAGDRRTPSQPRPPERRPTNASILVVEESDLVRHAIVRVLRRRGYEVREAANMSLAQLDQTPSVHLVIADAVALAENGSLGAGADRARLLCLSEDVSRDGVAVLPKPFADRELLSKVEELLGPPRGASGG